MDGFEDLGVVFSTRLNLTVSEISVSTAHANGTEEIAIATNKSFTKNYYEFFYSFYFLLSVKNGFMEIYFFEIYTL